jgi:hypothetical protein
LISNCTHCGAQYKLPDKMLGKQARCKACKRLFVIVPGEDEIELPQPTGSTTQMRPVEDEEDGLDALASAASGGDFAPASRSTSRSRYAEEEDDEPRRRRMAKGAQASMNLGIMACVLTAAGVVLMIIAMVNGKDQDLLITLGIIALGLFGFGAICSMIAVVNGTSAKSKIRRARHPLDGRSQASTGTITGGIALGVVFVCAIIMGVFLAKRGGIKFENEVIKPAHAPTQIDRAYVG